MDDGKATVYGLSSTVCFAGVVARYVPLNNQLAYGPELISTVYRTIKPMIIPSSRKNPQMK